MSWLSSRASAAAATGRDVLATGRGARVHFASAFRRDVRTGLICTFLASCAWLVTGSAVAATDVETRGGDFTLQAPDGPLSLRDLDGKVVLMFFGYTSCPDACPLSLAKINASFSAMDPEELARVRALFITLDPERDDSDTLRKYTGYFHPNIIGLREKRAVIDAVAAQYGVTYERKKLPSSAIGYTISHPTDILIVDTTGRLVDAVDHDVSPKVLLARIRALLHDADR